MFQKSILEGSCAHTANGAELGNGNHFIWMCGKKVFNFLDGPLSG
jgi:hypothetical protein